MAQPKEKKRKENKTKNLMLAQTPEQKLRLSEEMERLIAADLRKTISYHINLYRRSFESKLGMTEDDMLNDVRMQVYKGLLTWNPDKRANKKTYINNLIKKRFSTLHHRTQTTKYSSLDYYGDVFASPARHAMSEDRLETRETGEELLLRRQEQMRDQEVMTGKAQLRIYKDLLKGLNIDEMVNKHRMTRVQVVTVINEISARINERRENTAKGPL